ncbi:universal stress protein [Eilatimonas milleporae]|uniref:Nucleotide-binding universal stress UspA family protein n=1 Tax=Eilatimonas milleporae TaxID=911205 RepID=A0A3M0BZ75_9PROT|nr:universal stress protein [Eilatimonas milleporae]RMB01885.1 nucleotide-binding universal stress UspA family protein [Eilatimonas milleporae]
MLGETDNVPSENGGGSSGSPVVHSPLKPIKKRFRKFLVVVDDSPESKVAIRFAAARAAHITGGGLILFHCIRPGEFQHWVAVADRMREESHEEAQALLDDMATRIYEQWSVEPDKIIVEGDPKEELKAFVERTPDLFCLVLGAGEGKDPGPLVDYFAHDHVNDLPCPVILIPGTMSYEQVDDMA